MPVFTYIATDKFGNKKQGSVDARTRPLAAGLLKKQGLFVISLEERKKSLVDQLLGFRGIPVTHVVAFTRQFSTMVSAGLPISKALDVLAAQTTNSRFRSVLTDVLRDVEGGAALSAALGRFPDVFSGTYQALVRAGESSGKLDEILERLANTMEKQRELNSTFKSAMIYPTIVSFAMVGVFILLMVFIIPKLAEMYVSMGVDLPVVTQIMITISDFMVKYLIFILVGLVGFMFGIKTYFKTESGKSLMSVVAFKIPVFGKINRMKEITDFTRTLSLLIASAIPIVEALSIVSDVVKNRYYKSASLEAARMVEKGNILSDYMRSNTIFPPLLGQMTKVGEETGKMDEVLDRVAVYFEGEVDHMVSGLSAALEPVILIMLGGMVGFLIVSIITPIYKITSAF